MKVSTGEIPELSVYGDDYDTIDGTGMRDYIHVVDLAKGHVCAVQKLREHVGFEIYNLGTGVGDVGPFGTYAFLPQVAKWVLAVFMLLGREELFTLIAIFSRNFWK